MKRTHRESVLMRNRQRQSMQFHGLTEADCPKGKFRKRHPLDCGRTQCKCCHGEKVFGRPTAKQRSADEAFAQGLQDVSA